MAAPAPISALRRRVGARLGDDDEAGFNLVELLVVMLTLGLLAAIAIPAFINQRDKAKDADGKAMAHSAELAMETYAVANGGEYSGVDPAALNDIEGAINASTSTTDPYLSAAAGAGGGRGYTLTVTVPSTGNTFTIERDAATGVVDFTCLAHGRAGCPSDGRLDP